MSATAAGDLFGVSFADTIKCTAGPLGFVAYQATNCTPISCSARQATRAFFCVPAKSNLIRSGMHNSVSIRKRAPPVDQSSTLHPIGGLLAIKMRAGPEMSIRGADLVSDIKLQPQASNLGAGLLKEASLRLSAVWLRKWNSALAPTDGLTMGAGA